MTHTETRTYEALESIDNPALPPLGEMSCSDGKWYWDQGHSVPVDWDALVEAGYFRKVQITETREYL